MMCPVSASLPVDDVPPYASPEAWRRFCAKAVPTARHTIWRGALADDGYGRFFDPLYEDQALPAGQRSGIVRVSRWLWWAYHGPIPAGAVVMHLCDIPICCRLDDLVVGTQAENLRMAAGRDRTSRTTSTGRADRADRRGQAAQSRDIRAAVTAALAGGITDPDLLAGIVDAVIANGDPHRDQLSLFTPTT